LHKVGGEEGEKRGKTQFGVDERKKRAGARKGYSVERKGRKEGGSRDTISFSLPEKKKERVPGRTEKKTGPSLSS